MKHYEAQGRLWNKLRTWNVIPKADKDTKVNSRNQPIGHSTHNLFLKDKKTKQLVLLSLR